jgi:hypothetical protein
MSTRLAVFFVGASFLVSGAAAPTADVAPAGHAVHVVRAAPKVVQRGCVAHPRRGESVTVYIRWEYGQAKTRIRAAYAAHGTGRRVHFNVWDMSAQHVAPTVRTANPGPYVGTWDLLARSGGVAVNLGVIVRNGTSAHGPYIGPWPWVPINGADHFARVSVRNAHGDVGWCEVTDGR